MEVTASEAVALEVSRLLLKGESYRAGVTSPEKCRRTVDEEGPAKLFMVSTDVCPF